jgi:hypothetical protein
LIGHGASDKVLIVNLGRGPIKQFPVSDLLSIALPGILPLVDSGCAAVDFLLEGSVLLFPFAKLLLFFVFAEKD